MLVGKLFHDSDSHVKPIYTV